MHSKDMMVGQQEEVKNLDFLLKWRVAHIVWHTL